MRDLSGEGRARGKKSIEQTFDFVKLEA